MGGKKYLGLLERKKMKERMENLKEVAELLLPQGILDFFD